MSGNVKGPKRRIDWGGHFRLALIVLIVCAWQLARHGGGQ